MELRSGSFVGVHFTLFNVFATCLTYFAVTIALNFLRAPKYPDELPWVGYGKSWSASIKNFFEGFTKCRDWLQDGYKKYHKEGRAFVIPSTLGMSAEVSIPRSQMQWMLDQPDSVLSTGEAHFDTLNGAYAFIDPVLLKDAYHEHVIHKNLARNLNAIIPELVEEVNDDVQEVCGADTQQFKKVNLMDEFLMGIIPKITNRMLVGKSVCRNPEFLKNMMAFTMDVVYGFMFFPLLPRPLHPFLGPIFSLLPKYHYWKGRKYTLPIIKKRLEDMRRKDADDPAYADWKAPNDFISWSIRTAMDEGKTDELKPGRIAMRVCPLNFASIHTTALTAHSALIDILTADPSVVEALREEATRIYNEDGQQWTKNGLARMYKLDSAIRESQRHSTMAMSLISKKVVAKEGVTSPEGIHYPNGCLLTYAWLPVAHDNDVYEKHDTYDPFRFSRDRERFESMTLEEKAGVDVLKLRQSGMVTTGHSHQAFGHGRHACPGRFFVAHELKIMFAYLFMNYEIKPILERPELKWVGRASMPPNVDIEARRRQLG
ncbi:cytochrome P450 [Bimuria novae-zelandiae CBS 107.79]|uniref:Cytochrome P450 n=1 Tax=Bimuria novae-zelandiae CBS 107.79 TaxID=1447943 RepID=A0A6A5VX44_9PLEO|nr:cytochrome P450 [Bimuria novae-zelandiae CBS 107.79]